MGEIVIRQAILHALVASGVVEAALRAWRIRRADARLRFWWLALAFPLLVLPLMLVAAPMRATDRFAAGWALFASDRWRDVRVAGVAADTVVFSLLIVAGTLLFLRDVVPFLLDAAREYRDGQAPAMEPPAALAALVAELAGRIGIRPPTIVVVRAQAPLLFVRGVRHQTVVVSEGVLARLAAGELRAAVAHELAHVRFRDPRAGWLLMGARLVMFWNPAVQLTARAIVQETEHRADALAAATTDGETFVSALAMLASLEHGHIASRVAAVTAATPVPPSAFVWARLAAVGVALGGVVFFVV